jgi:hypothetical protein
MTSICDSNLGKVAGIYSCQIKSKMLLIGNSNNFRETERIEAK